MTELSVIIPTLDEKAHLQQLLASIHALDSVPKEILVADGGSVDGTVEAVLALQATHPRLTLIQNPDRFVSHGFNRAFKASQAPYVSLVGAHAVYPPQYFSTCIEAIASGACDAAGGFLVQRGKTRMGQAIAKVMSSKLGVGDTAFRTSPKRMYVDSVAFAVYARRVFEQVGLLDEELVRNQDDEFHYRLNQAGLRILMLPELEVVYYVRNSLGALFQQYYQYGYYKPLVLKKVRSGLRLRHLVPAAFTLYLLALPLAIWQPLWLVPLLLYGALCSWASLRAEAPWPVRLRMPWVFPVLHTAYGSGFLRGLFKK